MPVNGKPGLREKKIGLREKKMQYSVWKRNFASPTSFYELKPPPGQERKLPAQYHTGQEQLLFACIQWHSRNRVTRA